MAAAKMTGASAANKISEAKEDGARSPVTQLVLGLLFGIIFGFLLQKGGVAKYHVLLGILLLKDFTVAKVMLSAITVGTVGLYLLRRQGMVNAHIKPTRLAANIGGGVIFGIGFGLLGYCPGTGAAALGQGNLDAIVGVVGLVVGSLVFAETSGWLDRTILKVGDMGKVTLPELVRMSPGRFLILWLPALVGCLILINYIGVR